MKHALSSLWEFEMKSFNRKKYKHIGVHYVLYEINYRTIQWLPRNSPHYNKDTFRLPFSNNFVFYSVYKTLTRFTCNLLLWGLSLVSSQYSSTIFLRLCHPNLFIHALLILCQKILHSDNWYKPAWLSTEKLVSTIMQNNNRELWFEMDYYRLYIITCIGFSTSSVYKFVTNSDTDQLLFAKKKGRLTRRKLVPYIYLRQELQQVFDHLQMPDLQMPDQQMSSKDLKCKINNFKHFRIQKSIVLKAK